MGTDWLRRTALVAAILCPQVVHALPPSTQTRLRSAEPVVVERDAGVFSDAAFAGMDAVFRAFAPSWQGRARLVVVKRGEGIDAEVLHRESNLFREDLLVVTDGDRFDIAAPRLDSARRRRALDAVRMTISGQGEQRLAALCEVLAGDMVGARASLMESARAAQRREVERAMETVEVARAYELRLDQEFARLVSELAGQGPVAISGFGAEEREVLADVLRPLASQTGARAWLVRAPDGVGSRSLGGLYEQAALGQRDVLIVTNGFVWVVRCAALQDDTSDVVAPPGPVGPKPEIAPRLRVIATRLAARLAGAPAGSARSPGATPPLPKPAAPEQVQLDETGPVELTTRTPSSSLDLRALGAALLAAAAAAGLALRRRALRTRREQLEDAVATLEHIATEVFLEIDVSPAGKSLSGKAVELRERLAMLKMAAPTPRVLRLARETRVALEDVRTQLRVR